MNSVIWDWNGTLLNDIDLCIESVNKLLTDRNLPLITIQSYREIFSFPVQDYYKALGFDFDKEDFSVAAHQYIDNYYGGFDQCNLQNNAVEVLEYFRSKGVRQFVLSAMEHGMLEKTLKLKGIFHFFEGIAGLQDHYAVSKAEQGKRLISMFDINTEKAVLIGDTTHDYEVAKEMGIKCILVSDGHQSKKRLQKTGTTVIDNILQLIDRNIHNL